MERERLHFLKEKIEGQIHAADPTLLRDFPFGMYMDLIESYPQIANYTYVSDGARQLSEGIFMRSDRDTLELYHRGLLLALIDKALDSLNMLHLPDDINRYYHLSFERIAQDLEKNTHEPGFYLYPNDKFFKELGVCSLRLIPAGAQKISLSSLPAEFIFRNGMSQFMEGVLYVLSELKGFKPLYNMHTDSHDPFLMSEFNEKGWRNFLIRAAEMLKLNPEVRGIFGKTWFVDPQLEEISPRLCYVRKIFNQNGGRFFYIGPSTNGIEDAVYKSPTRKQLYDRGKYIPKDYLGIWSRKKLIPWAERQKRLAGQ